jgi:predicted aspartyl protease
MVSLGVREPGTRAWLELDAMIDSGSDLAGVPSSVAEALNLPPVRLQTATGFDGRPTPVPIFRVDLEISAVEFLRVEAIAVGRPYALIGRNVLNRLLVELDGPREQLAVRSRRRA